MFLLLQFVNFLQKNGKQTAADELLNKLLRIYATDTYIINYIKENYEKDLIEFLKHKKELDKALTKQLEEELNIKLN